MLIFSCGGNKNISKNILRLNYAEGIETFDPAFAKSQAIMWQTQQIYNRLIEFDNSGIAQPSLAKYWTVSEDKMVYTFYLRNDVYFQDNEIFENNIGRKMTAKDVAYSFSRIVDKKTASPGAWIFNESIDSLNPFVAVNDTVFELHLRKPYNPILGILSMQYCSIVPHEAIEKWGSDFRSHPCGTGPFALEYLEEGNAMVLKKNINYWEKDSVGNKLPYIDGVKINFIDSKASEFLMFMQNKIDFMNGIEASFKDEVLTKNGQLKEVFKNKIVLQKSPYLNVEYLGILCDNKNNNADKILLQKNIRQAINIGFDKNKLVKYLRNNIGMPGNAGMIAYGLQGFDTSLLANKYNVQKAKQLVGNANITQPIKLFTPDVYVDRCTFVASQLQDLGFNIEIEVMQRALLREQLAQEKIAFFWATWIGDYPDAENYLTLFYSKNDAPPNYTRYSNPTYDKLYEQALSADYNSRIDLYKKMDKIIMEDCPAIPLFYDEVAHFLNPRVKGWQTNSLNLIQFKKVWLME